MPNPNPFDLDSFIAAINDQIADIDRDLDNDQDADDNDDFDLDLSTVLG